MSHTRILRWLSVLLVLLALTTLLVGVGSTAQGPALPDRYPGSSPTGPLSLDRYLPPEQETQDEPAFEGPANVYGMNWSRVAFESARNMRDYNIYIAKPDGSSLQQLTSHSANDVQARLNRGATEIAFTSKRTGNWELYRMGSYGSGLTQLTFNGAIDADPCWSPDGQQIAFSSNRSGQYEIYVMNRDGSNVRQLTNNSAYDGEPSWSPDGSKIAFSSKRSGGYRIWVMNADGSGAHMLTWERSSGRPSWSPNGQKIAFHADGNNDSWFDIFVMNANGSNHVKLYDGNGWSNGGYDGYAGNWSPDGRYVSYTNVYWVKYGGNWYWQTATPSYLNVSGGYGDYFSYDWDMGWNPNWQTADISPPYSHVYPLADHSRDDVEVSWTAVDAGEAGLDEVLVQYRVGESGDWIQWSDTTNEYEWHKTFDKQSGQIVYFRSRATDKSNNVEKWPAKGYDTQTTFYDWLISGQISDNRGQPLSGATLIAGPEAFEVHPSDADGFYKAYFKGFDYSFSPSWGKDGYGQLPETSLRSDSDKGFNVILPPADNMVADWGFESGALNGAHWQTSGSIAPGVGEAYRHSGGLGVFLGLPFDLEAPALVRQASSFEGSPLITSDDSGALHMLWREGSGWDQVVYYAHKPAGGAWSAPVALSSAASNIQQVMWGSTAAGQIHVVWKQYDYPRDTIHHIWRSQAGAWSNAQIVHSDGRVELLDLRVGGDGKAHLAWKLTYTDYNGYYYSQSGADGDWDSPILTGPLNSVGIEKLAVGPDGRIHGLYTSDTIYYSYMRDDGTWSMREKVFASSYNWFRDLLIDSNGQAHVVIANVSHGKIYYSGRSTSGTWSEVVTLSTGTDPDERNYSVLMDPEGTLHITWPGGTDWACKAAYYMRKEIDGQWFGPIIVSGDDGCLGKSWLQHNGEATYMLFHSPLRDNDYFCTIYLGATAPAEPACADSFFNEYPNLVVDKFGVVQATWKDAAEGGGYVLNHTQTKTAVATDLSAISQQVTIPLTVTNPTLSLMVSLQGGKVGSEARLMAQIEDGSGPTIVLEADAVTSWDHQWADVSAWAGQTVTLTVLVQQAAGAPQVSAMLDEVTLGSAPPDLWLDLSGAPSAATGETFNLALSYGNRTPSPASGLQISLTLPAGLSYVSADPAPVETTPALIWHMGDLTTLEVQAPIIITVTMEAEFAAGLFVTPSGVITCQDIELEMDNNTASHSIRVGRLVLLPMIVR